MTTGTPVRPPGIGLTRDYTRLPKVEAELAALPHPDHTGFRAAVDKTQTPEVVIHAIRQCVRAGMPEEARSLGNLLASLATPIMEKAARARFPRSPELREELTGRLAVQVVTKMTDTTATAEFWEVHFESAVIMQSLSIMKSLLSEQKSAIPTISLEAERDDGSPSVEEPAAPGHLLDDLIAALDDDAVWREASALLDENVQIALRLKVEGYPDKSKDPSEPTISSIMGKTDRMLRNYWRHACEVLGPWLVARGYSLPGDETA